MSLHIGRTLRESGSLLLSRTGAILLACYLLFNVANVVVSNAIVAAAYRRVGLGEVAAALPAVFEMPLSVAAGGYLSLLVLGTYLSVVSVRTFVAGARESFPGGALTRNVPRAVLNVFVGGFVYGVAVVLGMVLFVIPGLVAYVAFLFLLPYIAVEDRNFVDALRESYRLSKGNWLTLGVLVLIIVAGSTLSGAVVGLLAGLVVPPGLAQLSFVLVQTPVSLYTVAVIAVAFTQLREGTDGGGPASPTTADTPSTAA